MTTFQLQQMDADGSWFIIGEYRDHTSRAAQYEMQKFRIKFPHIGLRIVEYPSRLIVVVDIPEDRA